MSYEDVKKSRRKRKGLLVDCLGGKCNRCGYDTCIESLDFHHIDPSKKEFALSTTWSKVEIAIEEAKKCILVCANCHRELHAGYWQVEDIEPFGFDQEVLQEYLDKKSAKIYTKTCKSCGIEYETKNRNSLTCSQKCSIENKRKNWPQKEELANLIWQMPTTKIAEMYNVSDKAVSKWCQGYNLKKPSRGYWSKNK